MSRLSSRPRWLPASLGLGLVLVALLNISFPAAAQSEAWSAPRLVFEGVGRVDWPVILADAYGAVHGLWIFRAEDGEGQQQVYYVRLDRPNWQPIDVFSYRGPATSMTAQTWAAGLLATWNGTQYGQADPAPDVSARAWRGPFEMGNQYFQTGVATAPDGALWMAYGSQADKGVYVQQMEAETQSWGSPKLVGYAVNPNTAPDWVRLAFAPDGTLHMTWAEYQLPDGFPPVGIYYARSSDNGDTWTTPRQIAPAGSNQPSILAGPHDEVYLAWVGMAGVGGKYLVRSLDGGLTWGEPLTILPPPGGSQGSVIMALDSHSRWHAIVANEGCVWYFTLEGETLSPGECISEPLPLGTLKEYPAMSLGLGNQLHVLFWTDRQQLWYTTRQLDAPALEPQLLPTAVPPTATTEHPTAVPPPTATHLPDLGPPPDLDASSQAATFAILAGIVPVVVFFVVVGLVRVRGRK